jgi:hypothetical protein
MRHFVAVSLSLLLTSYLITAGHVEAIGGIIYVMPSLVEPGGTTTVTGFNFTPGPVAIRIMGQSEVLAQALAGPDGTFTVELTLPPALAPDDYTLEAEALDGSKAHAELRVQAAMPNMVIGVAVPHEARGRGDNGCRHGARPPRKAPDRDHRSICGDQ